ncbi:MAG TPA: alcohol dehydrogenase catalytic domain-containing protein [Bryobacteraceae bacterium]
MKAIVKQRSGKGQVGLVEWPEPSPAPDEIKLKIVAAGICGTDIHIIEGTWQCRPPVVLGHEFCGIVVEVGSLVKDFHAGERVVASNPAQTCGRCRQCCGGNPFMCSRRVSAGYMIDGAFAEYLCIRSERCHHLPEEVSFRQAALGEPLSVAIHAVIERTTVHAGDLVLISGPGCVGLLTAQIAKLEGARVILVGTDKDERRLSLAKILGADAVVNASRENPMHVVQQLSSGEGADVVYECAGVPDSLDLCWEAVCRGGKLVPLGIYPGPIQTDFNKITMKELNVGGSYGYVWTSWRRCIQLLADRKVKAEELISHEFSLESFDEAVRATMNGSAVKVVLNPAGSKL